jgi:hypothetical protein
MERGWKWGKWLLTTIGSVLFALLIAATQVPLTQAASNLGSYAKALHLPELANILRAPSVDAWGLAIGITGLLVTLAIVARHLLRNRSAPFLSADQHPKFIPVWQAVQRIALINGEAKDTEYFPKSRQALRQAALDGEITLRGRKQIGSVESVHTKFDGVFVDIPRTYWEEFKIGPYAAVENEHVNNPYTQQLVRMLGPLSHFYAELQAPRTDVDRLWPLAETADALASELGAKKTALELHLKAARAKLKDSMSARDRAEAMLNDSPSQKTSEAYKHADDRVGEAIREHHAVRDEVIKIDGVMPREPAYMTAYAALHYMVDQSQWGDMIRAVRVDNTVNPQYPMRKQPLFEAMVEFRRVAEAGKITAFGRKNGTGDLQEIPSFYWASAVLHSASKYNELISETMPSDPSPDGISIYKSLRIFRDDVYRAWPRALRQDEQA